jgi:hypothetical protein
MSATTRELANDRWWRNGVHHEIRISSVGSASERIQGIGSHKDQGVAPGNGQAILSSLEEPTLDLVGKASVRIQGPSGNVTDGSGGRMQQGVAGLD